MVEQKEYNRIVGKNIDLEKEVKEIRLQTPSTEEKNLKQDNEKYKAALQEIADFQDCLFKQNAMDMREIAREAIK